MHWSRSHLALLPGALPYLWRPGGLSPEHPTPPAAPRSFAIRALWGLLSLDAGVGRGGGLRGRLGRFCRLLAALRRRWFLRRVSRRLDLGDALRELADDHVPAPDLLIPGRYDLAQVGDLVA